MIVYHTNKKKKEWLLMGLQRIQISKFRITIYWIPNNYKIIIN